MAEQRTRYYTILTTLGKVAVSNAIAMNEKVDFSYIVLGDGGGKEYEPTEEQTELKGKKTENIKIHNIIVIEENSQIELQAIIGASVGGFTIREAGIYDSKGNLLAISKIAERTKPSLSEGSGIDMFFKLRLEVSNTSIVNITVDPSALLVNINQFNQYKGEMNDLYLDLKAQVEEALAGGELEELIITLSTDLQDHIDKEITEDEIHGFSLITEELYRITDNDGKVPLKMDIKNVKGKATTEEAKEGSDDEKYMTPKKVKDFFLGFGDGKKYLIDYQMIDDFNIVAGYMNPDNDYNELIYSDVAIGIQSRLENRSGEFYVATAESGIAVDLTNYNVVGISDITLKPLNQRSLPTKGSGYLELQISTSAQSSADSYVARTYKEILPIEIKDYAVIKLDNMKVNVEHLEGMHYIKLVWKHKLHADTTQIDTRYAIFANQLYLSEL